MHCAHLQEDQAGSSVAAGTAQMSEADAARCGSVSVALPAGGGASCRGAAGTAQGSEAVAARWGRCAAA